MSEIDKNPPIVFISYSHDTKEHKRWVLELAQQLVKDHGIEVILDQWDLEYGDDIPKFMQRSVTRADRVLMICTETYVKKADEGKGGVGYEIMIVDGELVRNLGTRKFIPIIRQNTKDILLPKSVGTRLAVNLSEDSDRKEELKKLVEIIHKMPPPTKPPLGDAPKITSYINATPSSHKVSDYADDPDELYEQALKLARSGDLVTWRRLIQDKKSAINDPLMLWREKWEAQLPENNDDLQAYNQEGVKVFEPLFAMALAGVESGQPKFNKQAGLIYDLLEPNNWNGSGYPLIVSFPETSAFLFQALHGMIAIYSGQVNLAIDMANLRVDVRNNNLSWPLIKHSYLICWPKSLNGYCTNAWTFLWDIPQHLTWFAEKVGGSTLFHECLCGYYFLLSWMEYLEIIHSGKMEIFTKDEFIRLDVPATYLIHTEHKAGLRRLIEEKHLLTDYSERIGVSLEVQVKHWDAWKKLSYRWLGEVYQDSSYGSSSSFDNFIDDLRK